MTKLSLCANLLKLRNLTSDDTTVGCASRGVEAEILIKEVAELDGMNVDIPPNDRQRGFDLTINGLRVQVKQRTTKSPRGGGYVVDGIRPHFFDEGLVDVVVLVETLAPFHNVNRIMIVDAVHVFKHPGLYFSEYNKRHQLTYKRFVDAVQAHGQMITA